MFYFVEWNIRTLVITKWSSETTLGKIVQRPCIPFSRSWHFNHYYFCQRVVFHNVLFSGINIFWMSGITPMIYLVTGNSKVWVKNIKTRTQSHYNGVDVDNGEYFDLSYYIAKLRQEKTMQTLFQIWIQLARNGSSILPSSKQWHYFHMFSSLFLVNKCITYLRNVITLQNPLVRKPH